jgi:hypothetical protein
MFMAEEYHNGWRWDEQSEDYLAGYVAGSHNIVWDDEDDWQNTWLTDGERIWFQIGAEGDDE